MITTGGVGPAFSEKFWLGFAIEQYHARIGQSRLPIGVKQRAIECQRIFLWSQLDYDVFGVAVEIARGAGGGERFRPDVGSAGKHLAEGELPVCVGGGGDN